MKPLLSIIVPVYNGSNTISSCIEHLENLDYPEEKYEILIIDNNSDDNTKNIIQQYNVTYLFEKKQGQAAARNFGVTHAKGDILGFVDADCLVEKNWAVEIEKLLKNNSTSVVIGFCNHITKNISGEMYALDYRKDWERRSLSGNQVNAIAAANFAMKKNLFLELGGFDENFLALEDIEFGFRIIKNGDNIIYNPNLQVKHLYHDSLDTRVNKTCKYGLYEYLIFKKYLHSSTIMALMPSFQKLYFRMLDATHNKYIIRGILITVWSAIQILLFFLKTLLKLNIRNYAFYRIVLTLSIFKGKLLAMLDNNVR
ncbi:MAG: glycosyltransferase [Deltaproteobacteria bacterium]|nr:glycosyltransferase [Deltaproteobacteria bacterium]